MKRIQHGRWPVTPIDKKCSNCRTPLVAATRDGRDIDECPKCGYVHTPSGARPVVSPTAAVPGTAGRPCKVTKCPGRLDTSGRCVCCERRQAFREANTPKTTCGICKGEFIQRGASKFEYCVPCRPVAARAKKKAS